MNIGNWDFEEAEPPLPYETYPFVLYNTFYQIEDKNDNGKDKKEGAQGDSKAVEDESVDDQQPDSTLTEDLVRRKEIRDKKIEDALKQGEKPLTEDLVDVK